jgi:putative peptidoglycan lipid II flippase
VTDTSAPQPLGRNIASAAVVIGSGIITSRLLGLVREQVIAALFGSTGATSAFRTATRVTTGFYDLLLSGATTSALVPVFSDYTAAGKTAELSRAVSILVNLTLVVLGAVISILVLGAPLVVTALGTDPDQLLLAADLTRIALPSVVLLGAAGIFTSLLYARRSFGLPAFAAAIYNAGIIVAAVALAGSLGIYALAIGLLVGALLQLGLQLPAIRGLRYAATVDLRDPGVRLVLRLYAPVFLGMVVSYLVVAVDTHLAWRTAPESVADMAFATTLIQFPLGLVGAAASLAILPSLSRLASSERTDEREALIPTLLRGIKAVLLLIAPLTAILIVLREPIVSLLFERLAFDAAATQRTARALLAYAPQLPFVVVDQLLIVAFYALKETRTPVLVGAAGAGIYLVAALLLVAPLGMPGLALANAIQNSAHAVILYWLLAQRFAILRAPELGSFLGRVAAGGVAAAGVAAMVFVSIAPLLADASLLPQIAAVAAGGGAGLAAYGAALAVLRVHEARGVLALFRRPKSGLEAT